MSGVCHDRGWLEYLRLHNRIELNKINDIFLPTSEGFWYFTKHRKMLHSQPHKISNLHKSFEFSNEKYFSPVNSRIILLFVGTWLVCSLQTFNSKTRWCVMLLTSQRQPRKLYLSPTANKAICWYVAIGAIYWMGRFLVLWLDRLGPVSI